MIATCMCSLHFARRAEDILSEAKNDRCPHPGLGLWITKMLRRSSALKAGQSTVVNESDDPAKQAEAASWAKASADVLLYSAFVPIGLSLYDLLVCPIVIRVRGQEAQTWGELICVTARSCSSQIGHEP